MLLLKNGADVDTDLNGYKPLHWAIEKRNFPIASFLIRKGASINSRKKSGGETPLHLCSRYNNNFKNRQFVDKERRCHR